MAARLCSFFQCAVGIAISFEVSPPFESSRGLDVGGLKYVVVSNASGSLHAC